MVSNLFCVEDNISFIELQGESYSILQLKVLKIYFRFDNVRVPRENLLNSVADVSVEGKYISATDDPDKVNFSNISVSTYMYVRVCKHACTNVWVFCIFSSDRKLPKIWYFYSKWNCIDDSFATYFQRFAAFMAPLTSGRVTISLSAIYSAKVCWLYI